MPEFFHDYLGLAALPLARVRAVVLVGRRGAGKSSYIGWLRSSHPDVRARADAGELAVVDEVTTARELARAWRAVRGARLTLLASHLPRIAHAPLGALGPLRVLDLDRAPAKLERELERRRVPHGAGALTAFRTRFGANYTDLAIVLERYPGLSFDAAWARFTRECRIG
jgi:hypothetical protein